MPEGSTLLLFTDGLFERRGILLDEGRERVAKSAARWAGAPLREFADGVLGDLLGDDVEDDVALLAVRAHPVAGKRPPEAAPEILPPLA
jgi:serine phosphatase RsbU (regulator of sigma subunit)